MIPQSSTVFALLALLASATLIAAWTDEDQQKWDNGWDVNIFGEPLDPKTACYGEPCVKYNWTIPEAPTDLNTEFCKPFSANGNVTMCNHVPKNATLVSDLEFERIASTLDGARPKLPQEPVPPQTLRKRSRWPVSRSSGSLELYVWDKSPMTYSVAAARGLEGRIDATANIIRQAMDRWGDDCASSMKGGSSSSLFSNWVYVPSNSPANEGKLPNIWFHISPGTVCDTDAGIACAFFPQDYGRRTTVLINNQKLSSYSANDALKSIIHELGHVMGLAHEYVNDADYVWAASPLDEKSIMKPSLQQIRGISTTDCLAMAYYSNGFPEVTASAYNKDKQKTVYKKAKIVKVAPLKVKLSADEQYRSHKSGGHDELLMDTDDGTCLGSDISQYGIVTPLEKGLHGLFELGFSLSQCLAVRVDSNPDFFYAMQSDGNFVAYNSKTGKAITSTGTAGLGTRGGYSIIFQEDGNLVIYDIKGSAVWSSGTYFWSHSNMRLDPAFWAFWGGHFGILDPAYKLIWTPMKSFIPTYKNVAIQLKGTNYCLDPGANTVGKPTTLFTCRDNDPYQQWDIFPGGEIKNSRTGLCLDNSAFNKVPGAPVTVYTCTGAVNQKWDFRADGTIANPAVDLCVDLLNYNRVDFNPIQMWKCDAGVAQQWVIKP